MSRNVVDISVAAAFVISLVTAVAMRQKEAYRLWMVLKDILLTGLGMICIWSQIRIPHPNGLLLGTGLALCVPTVWQHVKALLPGGTDNPSEKDGEKNDPQP